MSALVSFFPSFDGDCQSGSFLIQRNRDKLSARKFGVGVFTQPGSLADLASRGCDVRSPPEADIQRCDGDVRFVAKVEVLPQARDVRSSPDSDRRFQIGVSRGRGIASNGRLVRV